MPTKAPATPAPATGPIGITVTCQGCGNAVSATNSPCLPTHCYWCANNTTPEQLVTTWTTPTGGAW